MGPSTTRYRDVWAAVFRWLHTAVVVAEVALTALLIGVPDFGAAYGLIRNGYPPDAGMLAIGELLVWSCVLAVGAAAIAAAAREAQLAWSRQDAPRRRVPWVIVAFGVACLAIGAVRHAGADGYSPCCGSPDQAEHALVAAP